ncbi:MAG: primosomal protein N' [Desulfobulbaceae bacterium]|uniref:Replication restart protein PriA n=1 Tax=Candidatus Desulfatifera sulfidica TaxID=2841691 RepID=A0A8J6N9E7_9BACT|nr:primosomal protein N' [Candidatus Desulfatifera sulfidica]
MTLLEVAVAAPLVHTLTYTLDQGSVPAGCRVLVPLGRRRVTGYVLGEQHRAPKGFALKSVIEILDRTPLFPVNLVPFFRWIADYYHYPLGEVIKTALPGGLSVQSRKRISLVHPSESTGAAKAVSHDETKRPGWYQQLCRDGSLTLSECAKILKTAAGRRQVQKLLDQGLVVIQEELVGSRSGVKTETCYGLLPELLPPEISTKFISSQEGPLGKTQLQQLLAWLPAIEELSLPELKTLYYLLSLSGPHIQRPVPGKELRCLYSGASKGLTSLLARGVIQALEQRVFRSPSGELLPFFSRPVDLSPEQEHVLSEILPQVAERFFCPCLLFGITGSGKTEVYLRAAEATLARGRDVLILVPEIALATQLEGHFVSRFGDKVVLMHSGLSAGERYDQWTLAASGQAKVVIGARSAVFAPLADPGLIIVDEEHDGGFKQDDGLRYNGRDLAVLRGKIQESVVILGSGTPSVTSSYHARSGKYRLLTMKKRVQERSLPKISLVDLRDKNERERGRAIGRQLEQGLRETLASGHQSLLLLNRRGFSSVLLCKDCGEPVQCRHCKVSLTYHQGRKQLICHHCGFTLKSAVICSSCRSTELVPVGFGTERIEDEIRSLFPEARIARLDADTAGDRKQFLTILSSMREHRIDILIGTQMIAKGHDFPLVTLVGVIWADGGLCMPDFRGGERTYQLLSQVAGRAGRGDVAGRVMVQTYRPDHYAVELARQHDYETFFEREIALRSSPCFPPLVRLVNLQISGGRDPQVRQAAQDLAAFCRNIMKELGLQLELLGPAPAPLERLRDRYRWQLLVKSKSCGDLQRLCGRITEARNDLSRGDLAIVIDVDPENLL